MSYTIEETPKTIDANRILYVLINYFFVDHMMVRKPWFGYDQLKKEVLKYQTVWQSNDTESLLEHFMFCGCYIYDNFSVVSNPDSLTPTIYPWDFVDYSQLFIKKSKQVKISPKEKAIPARYVFNCSFNRR